MYFFQTLSALHSISFGICRHAGEEAAAKKAGHEIGPGTLRSFLLDELYLLSQAGKDLPALRISEQ